ncbi:hypothetical protein HNY73_000379 [Argiope bruennichi]|uniref:Uncharacterized protein n=1 Tax=Argiope bruennichi TaxID=94029 RepID=A0A8T0G0A0_ARGBR|nr:hypothetical protein HNY73_000379 [Argiope bruennichi]
MYFPFADVEAIELHGFSDASEAAFGAVVYCKSQTPAGEVVVRWWPVNPSGSTEGSSRSRDWSSALLCCW